MNFEQWCARRGIDSRVLTMDQRIQLREEYVVDMAGGVSAATVDRPGSEYGPAAQRRALSAGLRLRCGLTEPPRHLREDQRKAFFEDLERGQRYSDMSLIDYVREACQIDTGRLPRDRFDQIRAAVSGGSLTAIFTDSVNAKLIQAWDETEDTTAGWVYESTATNFKQQERPQMTAGASLRKLARGKPAEHASPSDTVETFKVGRYAKQFSADEQDIIDDNVNALLTMPDEMGRASRRLRPDLVYALLLSNPTLSADNKAVFHADHSNLAEAASALSAATLQAGLSSMAKQALTEGKRTVPLNIRGRFLLVPTELFFTASILLNSAQRIVAADSGGTLNPLRDMNIQLVSDGRLGAQGVVDPDTEQTVTGSATNWFLAADPMGGRTVEVAYLNGTRQPVVRGFPMEQGQWGVTFDIKHDIGVSINGHRGLYKATGAS